MTRSLLWIESARWGRLLQAAGIDGESAVGQPHLPERGVEARLAVSSAAEPASRPSLPETPPSQPGTSVLGTEDEAQGPAVAETDLAIPSMPELSGGLEERLDTFLGWAKSVAGAQAAFIADTNGLALANAGADVDYIAASSSVLSSLTQIRAMLGRPVSGEVSLRLSDTEVYTVAETANDWGRFALCLISATPPAPKVISRVHQELQDVFVLKGAADE